MSTGGYNFETSCIPVVPNNRIDVVSKGTRTMMIQPASIADYIHPAICLQWQRNGTIAVISRHMAASTHAVTDAWADWLYNTLDLWNSDTPFLALHDMRTENPSSYCQSRALQLLRRPNNGVWGRYAMLIGVSPGGQLIQSWVNMAGRHAQCSIEMRVFLNQRAAMRWLLSG